MAMIRDRSSKQYVDPNMKYIDQDKIPEGMTFPALSTVPKEYLRDPNAPLPADRNPMDWALTSETAGNDNSTDERNQRAYIRDYLAQKYDKAANMSGVEDAMAERKRVDNIANFGHAFSRGATAQSSARGGPGVDETFWKNLREGGQQDVRDAESLRSEKIKDYLTTQRMGTEGVKELQQMHGYDQQNEMSDPSSNISRSYQNAFSAMYPSESEKIGQDISNMSASEIASFSKMYGSKADSDFRKEVERAKLGYADAGLQLQGRKLQSDEARQGQEMSAMAPKTQAEIDRIKADIALTNAKTKAVQTGKGALGATGLKPSKAYDAVDRDYAKDYNEWTVNGRSDYEKNMKVLKEAYDQMNAIEADKQGSKVSGRWEGVKTKVLGEPGRSSEGLELQKKVEKAVIGSLKAVAGANPTEGERAAVLGTAFNINLPLKANIENVKSIMNDLNNRAIRNEQKAKHFESKRTLEGMKTEGVVGESSQGPFGPRVKQGGVWYGWNNQTKQYEEEKGVK